MTISSLDEVDHLRESHAAGFCVWGLFTCTSCNLGLWRLEIEQPWVTACLRPKTRARVERMFLKRDRERRG